MSAPETLGRILAISPHLDDGVFSCGELLASHPHSVMVTVFAGIPSGASPLPPWDAACGFSSVSEAMATRRVEDRAALALLHTEPCWLDFTDSQYRFSHDTSEIADAVHDVIAVFRPDALVIPFGLFHSDHALVHDAALQLLRNDTAREWYAYEDALYRTLPGLLQRRLCDLASHGISATPVAI
jgi:LmbE family N-acetylglucosaminyl deacetylase